ncbi:putative U3 small nucleolar RNA-associated protein 11 [Smittium mucronatum]|uniref:Putative U3 small nucleolar RNA-associated protein 11 n=1 Tax=Smittium mucronatum TaxID=133383 RepID=A0A1R0H957_9FUNG|nr:putative U3 small nucleolar RNA-associated protein 11 [Smittium mucronatum]
MPEENKKRPREYGVEFVDDDFDYLNDLENEDSELEVEDSASNIEKKKKKSKKNKTGSQHTIFVDNDAQFNEFDASKHFDTPAAFLTRKFNRIRNEQLDLAASMTPSPKVMDKLGRERGRLAGELASRLSRQLLLERALKELSIQKNTSKKGTYKVVGKDSYGLPEYKWKYERKK